MPALRNMGMVRRWWFWKTHSGFRVSCYGRKGNSQLVTRNNFDHLCRADRSIAVPVNRERGKSGQHRASCFLTGRWVKACSKVTENDHLVLMRLNRERVKRWGKSSPVAVATSPAVPLTSCKAKYIMIFPWEFGGIQNGPFWFFGSREG